MNRPIKFRAWNKERKCFDVFAPPVEPATTQSESSRYIYEQFTGLTDKNGKEIYEGDIFEDTSNFIDGATLGDKEITYRGVVKFGSWGHTSCHSSYGFYMDTPASEEKLGWETPSLSDHEKLEVIGNIHENPELLK